MNFHAPRTDTTIKVFVCTFGGIEWMQLARERAEPSAKATTADGVVTFHGTTLQQCRNEAASRYGQDADWFIFLDGDDELDANYVEAMRRRIASLPPGDFIIQPSTLGVVDGVEDAAPVLIPARSSLWDGNHCVIGSAIPKRLFERVGGFDDWVAWEDWGLWLKCMKAGAQFTTCPEAIYRVHVDTSTKSRNEIDPKFARSLFQQMRTHYQRWEVPE